MAKKPPHVSETPATALLRHRGVPDTEHAYDSVLALPSMLVNGGRRGYLVGIAPQVLLDTLGATSVSGAL